MTVRNTILRDDRVRVAIEIIDSLGLRDEAEDLVMAITGCEQQRAHELVCENHVKNRFYDGGLEPPITRFLWGDARKKVTELRYGR